MKLLYAALRHDPRNPDLASGLDYNLYTCLLQNGLEVKISGPFIEPPPLFERAIKRMYISLSRKKYLKWDLYSMLRSSHGLMEIDKKWHPEVIVSAFPPPLAFYEGKTPCIFCTDTTFQGWQEGGADFGTLALKLLVWIEKRAVLRSTKIFTFSEWCRDEIVKRHRVEPEKIEIFPMPSALPHHCIPDYLNIESKKSFTFPLKLLLVGRDYYRKGVDIAIEVTRQLNSFGIATELVVCGLTHWEVPQREIPNVKFLRLYKKSDPGRLKQYVSLYQQSHFLLHPARFEPAGIVPSEAAAFGVPTLTNTSGGLATTVKNNESGVVLPKGALPEEYVKVILRFLRDPESYYNLCVKTRERYERELNWKMAGKHIVSIIKDIAKGHIRVNHAK